MAVFKKSVDLLQLIFPNSKEPIALKCIGSFAALHDDSLDLASEKVFYKLSILRIVSANFIKIGVNQNHIEKYGILIIV